MAPAKPSWWERSGDSLRRRSWVQLKDVWLTSPFDTYEIGALPDESVEDASLLRENVESLRKSATEPRRIYLDDVPGLRWAVLREGVALLHKAANVLAAAQNDFGIGFRSWSISTSYHAAFFAMRALCSIFGVVVASVSNAVVLVDVCAEEKNQKAGVPKRTLIYLADYGTATHQALWYLFQRLLRITAVPIDLWGTLWAGALVQLDPADFARQRNRLHYQPHEWPFDDIRTLLPVGTFGTFDGRIAEALEDPDREDFTVALSFVLVRMTTSLLHDLGSSLPSIREEMVLLGNWQAVDQNSHYRAAFSLD